MTTAALAPPASARSTHRAPRSDREALRSSTGEVYILPIMELQPGAVEYLWPPQARDGKPFSIRVELDCHQEVGEAIEEDNDVTVRFIG